MGLFFYTQKGSIISMVDLPTTEIIEPTWMFNNKSLIKDEEIKEAQQAFDSFVVGQLGDPVGQHGTAYNGVHYEPII